MTGTCVRFGWRAAVGSPRLVLAVWAVNGLLALVAGVAIWRWLDAAFAYAPEADQLLERFRVGLAFELMQYDRFSPMLTLNGAVLGLMIVAAIGNPLLSAGVLEVLTSHDDRPMLHRFLRGAGHFFGRFFRLLVISAAAAAVLFLLAAAVTRPIVSSLSESSWERTWIAASIARAMLLLSVVGLVVVVLDVARARVATAGIELRGMLRVWLQAARHVVGHLGAALGIALSYVLLFGFMLAAYLTISSVVPVRSWVGIVFAVLLQQLFMFGRAGLRVARAGAFLQFSGSPREVSAPVLQP